MEVGTETGVTVGALGTCLLLRKTDSDAQCLHSIISGLDHLGGRRHPQPPWAIDDADEDLDDEYIVCSSCMCPCHGSRRYRRGCGGGICGGGCCEEVMYPGGLLLDPYRSFPMGGHNN